MSAAIDRTRWARRPVPRTLEELATIARRGDRPVCARVELLEGWGEVFFDGTMVIHARCGWALGRRALVRLRDAEPFKGVQLHWDAAPELITIARPWARLRAELAWSPRGGPRNRRRRGPR